ncbi:MAG: hypothetical protein KJN84_04355, partial [Bacteroidia bacterium]|nr:hypothetical protein [Bacteroidia bacterium]
VSCSVVEDSPVVCNGESNGVATVAPVGGNGGFTYLWDNSETTQQAIALDAGVHTVTVTDSKGCTSSCSVTINEPSAVVSCSVVEDSPVVCNGESNGVATVTPIGGNGGFTYLWDNAETTQQAIALNAGVHTVTVTDSQGCSSSCSVSINEPFAVVSCSVVEDSPVVCNGESNGVATVIPVGGNGGFTYLWDNSEITQQATALSAGVHTVTVTDFKGCTSYCAVTINEPSAVMSCSIVEDSPVVKKGESNGVATVTPGGGNGGFTFLWDNNETTATAISLDAGLHVVTVTDSKGCTTSCDVLINEPDGYELGDYVWHDLNGDGIQNGNEPGLEGWFVTLYNQLGFTVDVVKTDASGYYLFENVIPGNYYLGVNLNDEFTPTLPDQGINDGLDNDLNNSKGHGTTSLFNFNDHDYTRDLGVYKCAKIGELVWFDYNENDIKDLSENGINGMKVELYKFGAYGWTLYNHVFTGHKPNTGSEDGFFKFCVIPGKYYLKFVNPPESLVTVIPNIGSEDVDSDVTHKFGPGTTDDFTLISGEEKCNIGAGYYPMGSIGDYIWSDDNENGIRDSGEPGIQGVVVNAYNILGVEVASAVSDEDGNYMIDYLLKDEYYLKVEPPIGTTLSIANAGDDSLDSDIDNSHGINTSRLYQVNPGEHIGNVDIGLVFGVLPIEWVDVWGENRENHNFIEWTVTSEINVSHYEMQVPDPNNNFEWKTIGVIDYVKSNKIENVYNYKDYQSRIGEYISYRIKQIDLNGGFSYSTIVLIENKNGEYWEPIISLHPNPPIDQFTITLEVPKRISKLSGAIYDQTGKMIKSNILSKNSIEVGKHNFQIYIKSLPAGIYVLNLQLDDVRYIERILIL